MLATLFVGLSLIVKYSLSDGQCVASIRVGGGVGCPPEWGLWRGKCYRATEELTWSDAKQKCIEMGGVMVVPQSQDEIDHLSSMHNVYWVGCNDRQTEDSWVCEDGVKYAGKWYDGEPSHTSHGGTENCMEIYGSSGGLNDKPCGASNRAFCKQAMAPRLHV